MFKSGYMAGFIDCLRIAKAFDDRGYLATTFTLPPRVSGAHWVKVIDELYEDESSDERQLPQMIALAGDRLEKKFGREIKSKSPGLGALRAFFAARRKAMLEAQKAKAAGEGSGASEAESEADEGPQPESKPETGKD